MPFSRVATIACESASSVPLCSLPARSRTEYWNVVAMSAYAFRRSGPAAEPVEVFDVVAFLHPGGMSDLAALDQLGQALVHRRHAELGSRLQRGVDLVRLALADEVADRRRGDQHLARRHSALSIGRRAERLTDHPLQRTRKLNADLLLLVRRKDVDDAVDRLRRVLGVQGGQHQVTSLRGGQRPPRRLVTWC